jgi:hypothetical protein
MKVFVLDKYPGLLKEFIKFLKSIPLSAWDRKTILPSWRIRDIVAHLTGNAIAKYSAIINFNHNKKPIPNIAYKDLVELIYESNEKWVELLHNLHPSHLAELFNENYSRLINKFNELDLDAVAVHSVAWAGENQSKNWFDIAREYTELWHHQMQCREAFND